MITRLSPIRCLALFGEVKDALTPAENWRYRTNRRGGKHAFGSMPRDFHRGKKMRARKERWHNLQQTLQRVSKAGKPTCADAAQMRHWQGLMLDTGMDPAEVARVSRETWVSERTREAKGICRHAIIVRGQARAARKARSV